MKSQALGFHFFNKSDKIILSMEKVKTCFIKRAFDITVSLALIVLLSPFIALIFLLMLIENIFIPSSRGGIFYKETRISAGEPFMIFKFGIFKKSVLAQAIKKDNFIHTKSLEQDKNNLTYTGIFLRRIYMDELPQLINVLKGEMSLVGPRPTNKVNYEKLIKEGGQSKYLIRAGITGYFQSHKGIILHKGQEELDMEYVNFCRNNSSWKILLLDIKILFITILTIFRAEGV